MPLKIYDTLVNSINPLNYSYTSEATQALINACTQYIDYDSAVRLVLDNDYTMIID